MLIIFSQLSKPQVTEKDVEDVQKGLAAAKIHDSELGKLQEKQRAAVKRSLGRNAGSSVHPDLQDLSFGGSLGTEQRYSDLSVYETGFVNRAITAICPRPFDLLLLHDTPPKMMSDMARFQITATMHRLTKMLTIVPQDLDRRRGRTM